MRSPDANVGIVCGAVSGGLVVVDADDNDAIVAVTAAIEHAPYAPPIVRTLADAHYYFRASPPPRNGAKLAGLPLDVRGEGGYVVAPPSVHESGHVYAWEREGDPAPLPDDAKPEREPRGPGRKGNAYDAVRALVAAHVEGVEYVRGAKTIRATWTPTGKVVELHVLSERNLQRDMLPLVGALTTFARTAHVDGKASHVLRAMRDLVPQAKLIPSSR